jgi:hypothetical protein
LITINEDSIWSGPVQDRLNPNGASSLESLQAALLDDDIPLASQIAYANFTSNPTTNRMYAFLADLLLTFNHSSYSNYERYLDVQNAVFNMSYESGGTTYTREWIASYPAKVVLGSLTSSTAGGLSFTAQWNRTGLTDGTRLGNLSAVGDNASVILAGLPGGAPNYAGMFAVTTVGGRLSFINFLVQAKHFELLLIRNAENSLPTL